MNDFPKEEFTNRISKIQENLEKENIEAIIITSPSNFRYFSGLDSNFWESPTRPWFLIISKKDPIKAIIPSIGITVMEKTFIKNNNWILNDVIIFKPSNGILETKKLDQYNINSIYTYEKITSLFKNFDTMSFVDLVVNYKELLKNGYNKTFLNQSLHTLLSLPFFLLMMTAIASILTMNTLKKSDNLKFITLGLIVSVLVFYFKNLSLALGQTDKIPLILAVWAPVLALSLFALVGVLQINEK